MSILLDRGITLEELYCPREALLLFDRALSLPEAERDPVDTGVLLHRSANCAVALGDGDGALASYVKAARHFWGLGMLEHCGLALAAAGRGLVDLPPTRPAHESVDVGTTWGGFVGVLTKTQEILLGAEVPTFAEAADLHRSLSGLIFIASFASYGEMLTLVAKSIYHQIARPFADRHRVRGQTNADEVQAIASTFEHLGCLCQVVADQEHVWRRSLPPSRGEVRHLAILTVGASGPSLATMLPWLGSYLRVHRGATWVTDEFLVEAGETG